VLLLVPGVAAQLYAGQDGKTSVYDHMRQAADLGAKFYACSDALAAHAVDRQNLIPEFAGVAGAVVFLSRVLSDDWATLSY
jgi:predicted peroxiredoxin